MEETQLKNREARLALEAWQKELKRNPYDIDADFKHSLGLYLKDKYTVLDRELSQFAERTIQELEPLVIENNLAQNLPRIDHYDGIGNSIEKIVHHPTYEASGNIIYSSKLLERMSRTGGLLEALTFMFLSSQAGEAGHNCPIACSAGIIRVLQRTENIPHRDHYIKKLIAHSYTDNWTGAQFITEVQGGSDVGENATEAKKNEKGEWRITGEKWFCSNANAELILMTARYDQAIPGTKGLGLFLVPAYLEKGERNSYTLRRLKDKIGTRSMASAEIDFHNALAYPIGDPAEGFKIVMENVLHVSRLFNTFCMLAMSRKALNIAETYAKHRVAFGQPILNYPLVKDNLARIRAENTALLASIFATSHLQDQFDLGLIKGDETKLLLRLLANLNKYISAFWSVEHIHHSLDILAGNGAIESFSIIPRLFRDSIVCENWEGTHNVLRMQILRDILRYHIDEIFLNHLDSLIALPKGHPIYKGIEKFKRDLSILKSSPQELQSLQIKSIVYQMAILYAALQLHKEARDQSERGDDSKQKCLDYFNFIHFGHDIAYTQQHLDLINQFF